MIVQMRGEERKIALLEVERVLRYGPCRGDGTVDPRVALHAANAIRALASVVVACDDDLKRHMAVDMCRSDPDVRRVVGLRTSNQPFRLAKI